jgi:hypothetical protein
MNIFTRRVILDEEDTHVVQSIYENEKATYLNYQGDYILNYKPDNEWVFPTI